MPDLRSPSLTIYRQALLAIALPLMVGLALVTNWGAALLVLLSETLARRWALMGAGIALAVLEILYVGVLVGLIVAGGSAARYLERLSQPQVQIRRRVRRFRVAAVLLSVVGAFAIAEASMRITGVGAPQPWTPMTLEPTPKVDDSVNSMGLREEWESIAPDDPRVRIAFLGDSFTYGLHVERKETFVDQLESSLSDACAPGVVTINLGRTNTAPGEQLELFRPLQPALRPDAVIHVLYPNDLGPKLHLFLLRLHEFAQRDLWFGDGSRVLSFIERQIRYWITWNQSLGYFRGGVTPQQRQKSWSLLESDVRACKEFAEEGGAVYAIVMIPWIYRIDEHPLRDVHERVAAMARRLGVPFLDLYPTIARHDEQEMRISESDEHFSVQAHAVAAAPIEAFLRDEVLPLAARCTRSSAPVVGPAARLVP